MFHEVDVGDVSDEDGDAANVGGSQYFMMMMMMMVMAAVMVMAPLANGCGCLFGRAAIPSEMIFLQLTACIMHISVGTVSLWPPSHPSADINRTTSEGSREVMLLLSC